MKRLTFKYELLRAERERLGYSQEEMARLLHNEGHPTTRETWRRHESGITEPSVSSFLAAARVLRRSPAFFFALESK